MGQSTMIIEVTTSRAVGRQILRHGFKPQEYSQRYALAMDFEEIELRTQDFKNRQASGDIIDNRNFNELAHDSVSFAYQNYSTLIDNGVSKETARMILPECTTSVMCLQGDVRTWISFLSQRLHKTAQKEIRMVAEEVRDIFMQELPIVSRALFDFENAYEISVFDRLVIEKYVKKGQVKWVD
jgi:thymidylate synthase (FAD)